MKLLIGSKNPTKISACEAVFPDYTVQGLSVASGVSAQPRTDEETREGAIHRAKRVLEAEEASLGAGLEGGVLLLEDELYLCNWGALVTASGKVFTASGARIPLPNEFLKDLKQGKELGEIMEEYTKRENIRSNEGAVGIFTNGIIDRREMFVHVMKLLRGQWEFQAI